MQFCRELIKKLKLLLFILVLSVLFAGLPPINRVISSCTAALAAEVPGVIYYGDAAAQSVIDGLKYTDLSGSVWSKEAIYEAGALGILKGLDGAGRRFGRSTTLTKEEALAIVYRAAGREEEALQAGTAVNNMRAAGNRKTDPADVLFDGFLSLAANDGLITARDLADAYNPDQEGLTEENFRRKSAAQRQEFAYWLALALNLQPAGQQQELLNYTDWRSIDPGKMQYIETLLRERIITGSNGRINPRQQVTREQGAQIVKNAEDEILAAKGYSKSFGIIEKIELVRDYTGGAAVSGRNITVANADGSYASIRTSEQPGNGSGNRNENTGESVAGRKRELVVYKDGIIGDSGLLSAGDRIKYIYDGSNTVKYVQVVSNINETRYVAVEVSSVDSANLLIDVIKLFDMDYPDMESIAYAGSLSFSGTEKNLYRISPGASVAINGVKADLAGISEGAAAIFTIDSNNNVRDIQFGDLGINAEARFIVRGIVEENNPRLGYLTLYNEDGSGTGGQAVLRTYNYVDQNRTEIYRNRKVVGADDIQAGDTAYIRLDGDGNIASISAVDNYVRKYGRVISRLPSAILVEFDDGIQELLAADANVVVVKDRMLVGFGAIKDGDRVRLLLNENGKGAGLKEITIESVDHYISNIYKGKVERIDNISGKIAVMNMQVFNRGNWDRVDWKGLSTIPMAEEFKIYLNDRVIDIDDANRLLYLNEAYIAVEETYGHEERAVKMTFRNSSDTPVPVVSDKITGVVSGSGSFMLYRENKKVGYSDGSIIVKHGRLVSGNSLGDGDDAYMALDRSYSDGSIYASVLKIDEPVNADGLIIYRGRISEIDEGRSFTLESFSQLQGIEWEYHNTPKTFGITYDTRVLNDDGVLNVRDFVGYGEDSYLQRTVYVASDGVNAVLVSTAPFGTENMRGMVYEIGGDLMKLSKVSVYDESSLMWVSKPDVSISLLKNTIVVKNGKIVNAAAISKGASVRVLKKNTGTSGDGYIVFIE
ncbi:MAG: S-layer homology domain-containing protein [Bacillota bacterium]